MKKTEIVVKESGEILDYLLNNTGISRNKIKSLMKYNGIIVNGRIINKFDYKIKPKDKIIIQTEGKKIPCPATVIYEDDNYLVVDKKEGLLTVSTDKERDKTLYHMIREYVKTNNKSANIFIVHRLDKDTSGIVLFVKNEKLKLELQADWNKLTKKRSYVAIVEGTLEKKEAKLSSYLIEADNSNMVYPTKNKTDGKLAITKYKVIKENKKYSMLDIEIETGRKNQIRVQLNEIGHKIVGDKKYGEKDKLKRMFLHANALEIIDPISKQRMYFTSNVPKTFKELMK